MSRATSDRTLIERADFALFAAPLLALAMVAGAAVWLGGSTGSDPAVQTAPADGLAHVPIALLALIVSIGSATYNWLSFNRSVARDQREALFKALEAYLKVREQKHKAEIAPTPSYALWFEYYRALFDLQWSEYYIWKQKALSDVPYRAWLSQHWKYFTDDERPSPAVVDDRGEPIGYRHVWNTLLHQGYFDETDAFVEHMHKVHANRLDEALRAR